MWCFEIHPKCSLSGLQVGQIARVPRVSTVPQCQDLLIQGYLGHVIIPPFSLLVLQPDGNSSPRAPLNSLRQVCDRARDPAAELLAGYDGDLLAHVLVGVEVITQMPVASQ